LAPQVPRVRFVSPPGEADTESVTDVDSEEEVTAMEASSKGLGMGKLPRNWEMDRKWYIGMCVSLCILRGNYRCILAWLVCIYISYIRIRVYNIYIYILLYCDDNYHIWSLWVQRHFGTIGWLSYGEFTGSP
jgi:hypothetical protein